jgi:hypothetical protein
MKPWTPAASLLLVSLTGPAAQPSPPPIAAAVSPPSHGVHRPISFTAGIGPGALVGRGHTELSLDHTQARIAFGLEPEMAAYLGFESYGATLGAARPERSLVRHDLWLLGLQYFPLQRVHLRAAIGLAREDSTAEDLPRRDTGVTFQFASGYELVRLRHAALALEVGGDAIQYPEESWYAANASVTLAIF